MAEWLRELTSRYGLKALYAAALLEGAGLPVPYEVIFVLLALFTQEDSLAFLRGLVGLYTSSTLGNGLGYWIGRRFGHRLLLTLRRRWPQFRGLWKHVRRGRRCAVLRHLLLLRWLGVGFGPALWMAGLARMPLSRFFAFMAAVNLPWVLTWAFLARHAASLIHPVAAVVVVVLAAIALHGLRRWLLRPRGSAV